MLSVRMFLPITLEMGAELLKAKNKVGCTNVVSRGEVNNKDKNVVIYFSSSDGGEEGGRQLINLRL